MTIAALVSLVVWIVVLGLVFWLLWWALSQVPLPEPFHTVARVVIALCAALVLIYFLTGIVPPPKFAAIR